MAAHARVGALVLFPLWRSLTGKQRAHGAVLALMIVWVSALGWVEERAGVEFDVFDQWRWDDEIFDLVRWVGWIPLAVALHAAMARGGAAVAVRGLVCILCEAARGTAGRDA